MNYNLTAYYRAELGNWTSRNALVTTNRDGSFYVYLYLEEGEFETYVNEHKVTDVNEAFRIALEYAEVPRELEVTTKTHEPVARWTAN